MDYVKLVFLGWVVFLFTLPVLLTAQEHPLKFEYSDIRFDYGCSYYTIEDLAQLEKLQTLGIDKITNVKGSISNGRWETRINESYFETITKTVDVICEQSFTKNLTVIETCTPIIEEKQVGRWRWSWIEPQSAKVSNVKLGNVKIRWCADIERDNSDGNWQIRADHIPVYDNVAYEKFAWWDSSYDYRYKINSNSSNATRIISVNDTFGIADDIIWTQNATESIYVYCENTDCTGSKAVANGTHQKCWFNETDGTGNCPDDVSVDNVAAWWTFNNATGTDVSGNAMHLTKVNTPEEINAIFGKGTNVHETDNYWTMSDADSSPFIEGQSEISVTAWVWLNETPDGFHAYFWNKDIIVGARVASGGSKVDAYISATGLSELLSNDVLELNTWVFLAQTYDGSDAKLYLNETLQATDSRSGNTGANAAAFDIGSDTIDNVFKGMMDDVRVYNVGLSQKDIQDIYYQGVNNHTNLGTVEEPPIPAVAVNLKLNGTDGNVFYLSGTWANISVSSNVTALVNLTANITGFVDISSDTPYENFPEITCTENNTYYNITAFIGNNSWVGTNETHYAICYIPTTYPYGVNIVIIEDEKPKGLFERWFPRVYKEILHFGMIIGDLNMGGNDILGVRNINASGNITGNFLVTRTIYAQLSDLQDQHFGSTGTEQAINLTTIDESYGLDISETNITIQTNGVYDIAAQPQVTAGPGDAGNFHMWLEKHNATGWADVINSNVELTLDSNDEDVIPLITTIRLKAGEKIRIMGSVSDTGIFLDTKAPAGEPIIPSIIFRMFKVGD